ncbi:hypothetical protein CEXT_667561, partial [Caerostris extrusa]
MSDKKCLKVWSHRHSLIYLSPE